MIRREDIIELGLNTYEFALGINYAQNFDLNVDLHSVDAHDVAPSLLQGDLGACV